jgi:adenylate cyclase
LSYRRKLLLGFVGITLATNLISLGVMFNRSRHYMFDMYRSKLLSVAMSISTLVDGDLLHGIRTAADEATPEYATLKSTLARVKDANRRQDTYIKRIFTVMRSPADGKTVLISLDSDRDPSTAAHTGEVYRSALGAPIDFTKAVVEESFAVDEFGKMLRASAPVRDRAGNIAGVLVVEAQAEWVESLLRPVAFSGIGALMLACVLAVPVAQLLSRRASRPLAELHVAVDAIGKGEFATRLPVTATDEFGDVARAVNAMAEGLSEREKVKGAFARYVSRQVLDSVLAADSRGVQLSGERRRVTVLFTDIRGFSSISEKLPPEGVVRVLNEYFERMVEIVFRNKGTLDKFIGDGMMVIFGAPEDDPHQEEHALQTAIEMQRELRVLAKKWEAEGIKLRIGVGINSGPAVVGNIGSPVRMEYTAIGDTVNLASRLESATKECGAEILISEYTYNGVRGSFQFEQIGPVQVRGRSEPVLAYAVVDEAKAKTTGA